LLSWSLIVCWPIWSTSKVSLSGIVCLSRWRKCNLRCLYRITDVNDPNGCPVAYS
jgi:hypothetical protein